MTSRLEGVLILLCCVLSLTAILFMVAGGAEGPTGPPGIQGVAGAQGVVGPSGTAGAVGATGSQGVQGVQGVQGIPGEVGSPGEGFYTQLYTENFYVTRGAAVYLYGSGFPKDPELYLKDSSGKTFHFGTGQITAFGLFDKRIIVPVTASIGVGYFFACEDGTGAVVYTTWPVRVK